MKFVMKKLFNVSQLTFACNVWPYFDGLMQERRNSIADALELRLSCTNPSGLMQERRNSIANALELRLSCTNPSIWTKP